MNMNFTSVKQSEMLVGLGLPEETADMAYIEHATNNSAFKFDEDMPPMVLCGIPISEITANTLPCWSSGKLLELIPLDYKQEKSLFDQSDQFTYSIIVDGYRTHENDTLIDACVEMVSWLLENDEDVKNYLTKL